MKKKILITGASGFIGSFLVEEAISQGFEVVAGIRKSSSKTYLQQPDLTFLELDFSSLETLTNQFKEYQTSFGSFDFVIHNAGVTQAKQKDDFITVNLEYTKNLINAIIDSGMKLEKFSLISSLASFGPGNKKTFIPVQQSHEQKPITDYGNSKLLAEQYLKSAPNFPYQIIEPTAVYGPRDKDFLQFVQLVNKGFELYIGAHQQMISMIYVKDLARAVVQLLLCPSVNKSYIVSDGNSYQKDQLGDILKTILQRKVIKIKIPLIPIKLAVAAIEKTYQLFGKNPFLNLQKLNEISCANWTCISTDVWNDIGSQPAYYLEEGMKETVAWYQTNDWLK